MQVVVNEKFLERRAKLARLGTWGGIGILFLGFILSLMPDYPQYITISWIAMIVGFTAFNFGRYNAIRWVTRPREDEMLAYGFKGLDHRHKLLNYMPGVSAGHVLLAPSGVYVVHVRRQDGVITNTGSKWSRKPSIGVFLRALVEGALGNPTQEALHDAESVAKHFNKTFTSEDMQELPVYPVIVFIDPRVKLTLRDPLVPVVTTRDLKGFMRKRQKDVKLGEEQLGRLSESFGV